MQRNRWQGIDSGMFKKISGFRKMFAEYIANALSEKSTIVMAIDQSADSEIAFDCKYIDELITV